MDFVAVLGFIETALAWIAVVIFIVVIALILLSLVGFTSVKVNPVGNLILEMFSSNLSSILFN